MRKRFLPFFLTFSLLSIIFIGMVVGSSVSVFAKDTIHGVFDRIRDKKWGLCCVVPASLLLIASETEKIM